MYGQLRMGRMSGLWRCHRHDSRASPIGRLNDRLWTKTQNHEPALPYSSTKYQVVKRHNWSLFRCPQMVICMSSSPVQRHGICVAQPPFLHQRRSPVEHFYSDSSPRCGVSAPDSAKACFSVKYNTQNSATCTELLERFVSRNLGSLKL
jgi:hypothetical protein